MCAAIAELSKEVSASQDDPYAVQSGLQARAAALDDGAVSVIQVDPVAGADTWDEVKANNLPPRPDEHCAGTVNPAESGELPSSAALRLWNAVCAYVLCKGCVHASAHM